MEEQHQNLPEEQFSDNPAENLRIENDLLKLKLQAERGASFLETDTEIPPEIEAQFLRHVQAFEEACERCTEHTVRAALDYPVFPPAAALDPAVIEQRCHELISELQEKGIQLDFLGSYPPEVIYDFLTTEFMDVNVMRISVPGFRQCFIYEEFHPNYQLDIERAVNVFIQHWFEKRFTEYCMEIDPNPQTPAGETITRAELMGKISRCLDCYTSFSNRVQGPLQIQFDWNEAEEKGTGRAEGHCSYDARLENGLLIHYEGPFCFHLTGEPGWWSIRSFEFPGFAW